ncbi:MAG: Gfo/Idh/MocA family oxidoreductase, partial [Armatimonadota bacterium]
MSTSSTQRPLKTAIVGCGGIARWHARAMLQLEEYDLAAVCDLDEDAARRLAQECDVEGVYTDYGAMLAEERP